MTRLWDSHQILRVAHDRTEVGTETNLLEAPMDLIHHHVLNVYRLWRGANKEEPIAESLPGAGLDRRLRMIGRWIASRNPGWSARPMKLHVPTATGRHVRVFARGTPCPGPDSW